ncbi:ABC transporter ATP-binding protein [Microtetraspora sp. NBRC 13810]|uniref:ABC transporter ATP-binding protein n=1 Tax=Microtetraspora sp. NBRC 13810 TaxID=3030990 RepID=UPI0024A185BC|nr:ABC transporter ATP-binding protein [Microtetraspora sp. NBRC 13810]GLW12735.1 ABC transporter ATP-binding protein [Microtetraspora sp. NBRC 13810]
MSPLLEVEDLHVEIPLPHGTLHAVRGVSLTADAGEAVGLVGESGSGKSLTLRALLGLLPQPARISSGRIVLDGVDVTALPARERRRRLTGAMGMVFQDSLTALNPVMRVGAQIAEAPRRKLGMSAAQAKARAVELMERVGIPDPERRYRAYPHELSGGMRQRICIAIALSGRPRLILADEPTTALDVTIQAQVLGVVESLRRAEGVGLILVSHDLAVVSETCRRIYVMYAGRVVESGPILDVLSAPRHPYSFALLRSVPDPDAPVHRLLTIPGQPPDLMETAAGCSFAPRCLFAADACREQDPPLVALPGDRATACLRHEEADRWSDLVAGLATVEEV